MKHILISVTVIVTIVSSCKKFVEVDPPRTDLVRSTVFASENTANAAMSDIYHQLKNSGFASGDAFSLSFLSSFSSDELIFYGYSSIDEYQQFNNNMLDPKNGNVQYPWDDLFKVLYKANAILEGVQSSTQLSEKTEHQLEGEALFVRAFCYFYLVNFWGEVPLVLTTDYEKNNQIDKSPITEIYDQIITDLKKAQDLLLDDYSISNNEKVRANRSVVTALLARVYLYTEKWSEAEEQSSSIINNSEAYSLEPDLQKVFRTTSKEAIFQLWNNQYPNEYVYFLVHPSIGPLFAALRQNFIADFDPADLRRIYWINDVPYNANMYYGCYKYQSYAIPPEDYSTVFRLAEQFLIRAEARAKQGNITGVNSAESDINEIRNRANLDPISITTEEEALEAVELERKHELFCESGHRWLDLKRTGRAAAILGSIKPGWESYKELYPIPESQIISNPKITQNTGY